MLPKLHLATNKKHLNPVFGYVYWTGNEFVATNSHIMVVWEPVRYDFGTESFYVHADDWKQLVKECKTNLCPELILNKSIPQPKDEKGKELTYPDWTVVWPQRYFTKKDLDISVPTDTKNIQQIGINALLLVDLSNAMDCINVKLSFYGESRGIHVLPQQTKTIISGRFYGVIMPVYTGE